MTALAVVTGTAVAGVVAAPPASATPSLAAGSVTTVAGSGSAVSSAGSATTAGFKSPSGVAVIGSAAFVGSQDVLSRVDAVTGATTILAGTPGTGAGCSDVDASSGASVVTCDLRDLTTDGTYLYFIDDQFGSSIRKTNPTTGATTTLTSLNGGSGGLHDLTVGPDGQLYVTTLGSNYGGGKILKVNPSTGTSSTFFTEGANETPYGITSDATKLYVASSTTPSQCSPACTNQIVTISLSNPTGETTLVTDSGLSTGFGIEQLGGYVYAEASSGLPTSNTKLRRYSSSTGAYTDVAGAGPGVQDGVGSDGWFGAVHDVASDGTNLYIADAGSSNRLRKVAPADPLAFAQQPAVNAANPITLGGVTTIAGSGAASSTAGPAMSAGFKSPTGLTLLGNSAYVGDADSISKMNLLTNQVSILAGSPGTSSGCTDADALVGSQVVTCNIKDLTTDGHFLYMIDGPFGSMLRRVDPTNGATSTIANIGQASGGIQGVAVGPDGFLYVTAGALNGAAGQLLKLDPITGSYTVAYSYPYPEYPTGIAVDAQNIFVSSYSAPSQCTPTCTVQIRKFNLASPTSPSLLYQTSGTYAAYHLESAGGYLYTPTGQISGGHNTTLIRVSKTDGSTVAVAGSPVVSGSTDGIGTAARFGGISDLAVDTNRLLVADVNSNRLRLVLDVPPPITNGGPIRPGETQLDNPSELSTQCACADPVNTATGFLGENATDLSVLGRGPALVATRSYSSQFAGQLGRFGYGWTDGYAMSLIVDPTDGSGPLATSPAVDVVQENGARTPFVRNADGSYTAPTRVLATLVRNGDGSYTFTRHARSSFAFNSTGALARITDLNGYSTTLAYNGSSQLTTATEPAGRTLTFGYGTNGLVASITDTAGRTVGYGYDASLNLTSVTDPAGNVTGYGYDSKHQLTSVTDPRSHSSSNVYDNQGRVTSQTDRAGRTTTFSYAVPTGPGSGTVTITDPKGNVTEHDYSDGEVSSSISAVGTPEQATTNYGYDPVSNGRTSMIDPLQHTWRWTYDSAGNQLSATDPLGHGASATYNSLNEPLTSTDANGVTTTFSYDAAGNLLTSSTPLVGSSPAVTALTSYTYGDPTHPGDVTAVTDPRGKVWTHTFDSYGQLTASSDPLGDKTTNSYTCTPVGPGCRSNIGWTYATVAPKGNAAGGVPGDYTTSVTRDDDGRMLTATDPRGKVTSYGYDANGNRTQVTDANLHATHYTFDNDDEQTLVTRPDGTTLGTGYDANGNVHTQTNGAGKTTTYEYDPLNRPVSVTDPLNHTTLSGYDLAGRLISSTDPANRVTSFVYDDAGRRTSIDYADPATPDVTFGYDNTGRRIAMTDGTGSSSWLFDSLGRLTNSSNGAGATVGYGYDLAGNQTSLTYPNGKTVTRVYDDANRLTKITDWLGHDNVISPDENGNTHTVTYGNGVASTNTFDQADRLMGISHTLGASTLASFNYGRDDVGLLTADTPTGLGNPESYGHDSLNRLTSRTVTGSPGSGSYGYDPGDNLTGLTDGTSKAFDAGNEVTAAQPAITLVGTGSAQDNGTGSALSLTLPSTRQPGDVILLSVVTATAQTVTTPTGYTSRGVTAPAGNQTKISTFSRTVSTGDAGTAAVSFGTGVNPKAMLAAVYRGVTAATPIEASGSGATTTSNTLTVPSISSLTDGARLVMLTGETANATAESWTVPAGMTDQVHGTGQSLISADLFDQTLGAAGATGARSSSVSLPGNLVGVLWALKPISPTTFTYNTLGDRTNRSDPLAGTSSYGYDQASRLTSVTGTTTATYRYDGSGLRAAKTVNGLTTAFSWDQSRGLPLLLDDGTNSYLYGPDGTVLEQIANTAASTVVGTGSKEDNGSGSSLTAPLPASIRIRDQILLTVTANATQTINTPAGYILVQAATATGNTSQTVVFRKTAAGTETSATVTFGTGLTPKALLAVVYRGVDPANPIDVKTTGAAQLATSLPVGSITTTAANEQLVLLAGAAGNTSTAGWTPPSGMADRVHLSTQALVSTLIADQTLTGSGPTGSRTATLASSGDLTGVLVALRVAPAPTFYYQHDQLGSTRLVTDQYGSVAATYSYDPYGNPASHTGYLDTPLQYGGQYRDTETGLYYLRARYYDPQTAQYLTRDPLEAVTRSAYGYVAGDPLDGADPSGLCNKNPFSGSFWTNGNCLSGAVGGPNGGGSQPWYWDIPAYGAGAAACTLGAEALCLGAAGVQSYASMAGDHQSDCTRIGGLRANASAAEARAAADAAGFKIPDGYVARPASGDGWIFQPVGATGDESAIRVMGPDAAGRYPNGYVRTYNPEGVPVDINGLPLGTAGVGQPETHFPLLPEEP